MHAQGHQTDLSVTAASPEPQRCTLKLGRCGHSQQSVCKHPPRRSMTNISARESRWSFRSTRSNKLQSESLCCTCRTVLTPCVCAAVCIHTRMSVCTRTCVSWCTWVCSCCRAWPSLSPRKQASAVGEYTGTCLCVTPYTYCVHWYCRCISVLKIRLSYAATDFLAWSVGTACLVHRIWQLCLKSKMWAAFSYVARRYLYHALDWKMNLQFLPYLLARCRVSLIFSCKCCLLQ